MRSVLVAVVLLGVLAPPAAAAGLAPAPGTVRLGPEASDPADGGRWTVRSWMPGRAVQPSPDPYERCLQVGRPDGARLTRVVRGATRVLRPRDRTVCGSVQAGSEYPPIVVERLLADPAGPPAQTIVAGALRHWDTGVTLAVGGVPQPVAVANRRFLAVLPGTVRRLDVAVTLAGRRVEPLRFAPGQGDGYRTLIPGTLRRALTVPALDGRRDVGVTAYDVDEGQGGARVTCLEVGRVVGEEAGAFTARWDVFLDAPIVGDVNAFQHGGPTVADPASRGACSDELEPGSLILPRTSPTTVAFAAIPDGYWEGFQITRGGVPVPTVPIPGVPGGIFAQLRSTGALGERARVAVRRDGRRVEANLWLGRHDRPAGFARYAAAGRRLRVAWRDHDYPAGAVRVQEGPRRVRIRVTTRFPPTFDRAGFVIGRDDEPAGHCVDIVLRRPLGGRRVVDATSGRTARPGRIPAPSGAGCPRR